MCSKSTVRHGDPSFSGTTIIWLYQVEGVPLGTLDIIPFITSASKLALTCCFNNVELVCVYDVHEERQCT